LNIKLQEIIKEELVKLPKESQDSINSIDWGVISEEIIKKYCGPDWTFYNWKSASINSFEPYILISSTYKIIKQFPSSL
jgi:hypothetical protein